jgi:hypothetical protein
MTFLSFLTGTTDQGTMMLRDNHHSLAGDGLDCLRMNRTYGGGRVKQELSYEQPLLKKEYEYLVRSFPQILEPEDTQSLVFCVFSDSDGRQVVRFDYLTGKRKNAKTTSEDFLASFMMCNFQKRR